MFIDQGRGPDGKRLQHTEVVRGTRKDAEARERELLRERDGGGMMDMRRITVAEFMEWLRRLRELRESSPSRQRIGHQSPQPGASAGSTANRAISRRRQ